MPPPTIGTLKPHAVFYDTNVLIYCDLIIPQFVSHSKVRYLRTNIPPKAFCNEVIHLTAFCNEVFEKLLLRIGRKANVPRHYDTNNSHCWEPVWLPGCWGTCEGRFTFPTDSSIAVYEHVFDVFCVHSELWIHLYGTIYTERGVVALKRGRSYIGQHRLLQRGYIIGSVLGGLWLRWCVLCYGGVPRPCIQRH